MKRLPRTPFFEIGVKNYVYGDTVLEYALAANAAAEKYDIDVLFTLPGRGAATRGGTCAAADPAGGLHGHAAPRARHGGYPSRRAQGQPGRTASSSTTAKSRCPSRRSKKRSTAPASWTFSSLPAPTRLTRQRPSPSSIRISSTPSRASSSAGGSGGVSSMDYVLATVSEIRKIDPAILVEQAAGITNGEQVYRFLMAGSAAAGAASGIVNAPIRLQ